jgi:nucleotidyltransferase substrate binding protein (TIGR01987 family)
LQDIRWLQRFDNYKKALDRLIDAYELSTKRELSELEEQGVIQVFEFTHELAWNCMKDYIHYQGNSDIKGSRDATREAFKIALIKDGESWMHMIQSRNLSSHTYDLKTAKALVQTIFSTYLPLFKTFKQQMQTLAKKENIS